MSVGRIGGGVEPRDLTTEETQSASPAGAATQALPTNWLEQHFHAISTRRELLSSGERLEVGGPIGVEFGAKITYSDIQPPRPGPHTPTFTVQTEGGIPHHRDAARPMTRAEMTAVMHALEKQLGEPPVPGSRVDHGILSEMIQKLAAATGTKISTVFDAVRWGSAHKLPNGSIAAEGGFGVDQIMDLALDKKGQLTYRPRLVMGPFPGQKFKTLDKAERADLARSLDAFLANKRLSADSPWRKLQDAAHK